MFPVNIFETGHFMSLTLQDVLFLEKRIVTRSTGISLHSFFRQILLEIKQKTALWVRLNGT